jgi:EAL and modified HD-GYP domain-containing signal transduction protein
MPDIFIGRQPVFDKNLNVFAYELLFRGQEDQTAANVVDGDIATSQVILNSFADIGLENLVGRHLAFINMTRYFLQNPDHVAIPPGQLVLEVPADLPADESTIEGLHDLKNRGHTIALDNFEYREEIDPLVDMADIVTLDVQALGTDEIRHQVDLLKSKNTRLLAIKVESYEQFELLKQLGFDYYQGFFFSRPTVIKGKGLSSNQVSVLRVVAKIYDPDLDVCELSDIISTDVSLSHKIMKFINSSANGPKVEVDSIQRAVVMLGINTIKNWATLVALAAASDKPDELCTVALVRARSCEQLARTVGQANPDSYFTLGLFSTLEAMMDMPVAILLESLPLSDEMKSALIRGDGVYGQALDCVLAMETDDLDKIQFLNLNLMQMSKIYLGAIAWADRQLDVTIQT